MTDPCDSHRPYLAAVADGETDIVPPSVFAHLESCADCAEEVRVHALLGETLRTGLLPAVPAASAAGGSPGRATPARSGVAAHWRWTAAAAAAAILIGVGVTAGLRGHPGPDPVVAASTASLQQPVLRSTDARLIASWCAKESERSEPPVDLPMLMPEGARTDTGAGASVVTIFYTGAAGGAVTVGWIDTDATPPAGMRAETRTVSGRTVIVLETRAGTAVVAGSVPLGVLWLTAGAVEAAVPPNS